MASLVRCIRSPNSAWTMDTTCRSQPVHGHTTCSFRISLRLRPETPRRFGAQTRGTDLKHPLEAVPVHVDYEGDGVMAGVSTYKCACCGSPFTARTADRKRGWARYCSKRCKAIAQEKRTGQYAAYMNRDGEPGLCFPSHAEGEVQ